MPKTPVRIKDVDLAIQEQLNNVVDLPKISAPYASIINRAKVTDFSKDLMPKFGVERIPFTRLQRMFDETEATGLLVWKDVNDLHNQVRFCGKWTEANDSYGRYVSTSNVNDFVEVTFFGTGLNLLSVSEGTNHDLRATVDGGAEGSDFYPAAMATPGARYQNNNIVVPVVSGLTQGLHTVKVRLAASAFYLYGLEIVNSTTTILYPQGNSYSGGKKLKKSASSTDSATSNFESGSLGTKGGCVVVYQKKDSTIAKAVNPTDATAKYLTNADHSNEEVVASPFYRTFGSSLTDDFSHVYGAAGALGYTLDDNETNLKISSVFTQTSATGDEFTGNGVSTFFEFVFVGTGLDISRVDTSSGTDTLTVNIDGTDVGTLNSSGSTVKRTEKIASGLPYGTHKVRITRTTANSYSPYFSIFTIYAPKKPELPAEAVELSSYYVLANYSFADSASYAGSGSIGVSAGAIYKSPMREWLYQGSSWTIPANSAQNFMSFSPLTTANGDSFSHSFFGTGVELLVALSAAPVTMTIQIDGVNYTGAATVRAGDTWTSGSSTWTMTQQGRLVIQGLTLGHHIVKVTKASGANIQPISVAVITPVHARKDAGPCLVQGCVLVGNQTIADKRKFSATDVYTSKANATSIGLVANPTTSAAAWIPLRDCRTSLKTKGNPIRVSFAGTFNNNTAGSTVFIKVQVDGVDVGRPQGINAVVAGYESNIVLDLIVPVSAGEHSITVYWVAGSGTARAYDTYRTLTVEEI